MVIGSVNFRLRCFVYLLIFYLSVGQLVFFKYYFIQITFFNNHLSKSKSLRNFHFKLKFLIPELCSAKVEAKYRTGVFNCDVVCPQPCRYFLAYHLPKSGSSNFHSLRADFITAQEKSREKDK